MRIYNLKDKKWGILMNWYICAGQINGRYVSGAGITRSIAIDNAFKS